MIMKKAVLILLCLWSLHSFGQNQTVFNHETWKAPYSLPVEGWGIERFPMPIDFAPTIPYKGVEDLRFAKGWGESGQQDYWTYSFLWYIEGIQEIPADMVTKTKTQVKKLAKPQGNDEATYSGTVSMLDYMAKKPMVLNCMIHVIKCPGTNNTFVFHQLSPQPFNNPVWTKLNELRKSFDCNKQ